MTIDVFMHHLAVINNKSISVRDERGNFTYTNNIKLIVGRYAKATDKDQIRRDQKDIGVDIIFYTKDFIDVEIGDVLENFYYGDMSLISDWLSRGVDNNLNATDLVNYLTFISGLGTVDTHKYMVVKFDNQFDDPLMHHQKFYLQKVQKNESSI